MTMACRGCVFGNCKSHSGDPYKYPKDRKEEQPVPDGAIRVYLTAGKFAERKEIGYVEDLSYLPELLESTADELRCMMIEQHMRQEAEKLKDG